MGNGMSIDEAIKDQVREEVGFMGPEVSTSFETGYKELMVDGELDSSVEALHHILIGGALAVGAGLLIRNYYKKNSKSVNKKMDTVKKGLTNIIDQFNEIDMEEATASTESFNTSGGIGTLRQCLTKPLICPMVIHSEALTVADVVHYNQEIHPELHRSVMDEFNTAIGKIKMGETPTPIAGAQIHSDRLKSTGIGKIISMCKYKLSVEESTPNLLMDIPVRTLLARALNSVNSSSDLVKAANDSAGKLTKSLSKTIDTVKDDQLKRVGTDGIARITEMANTTLDGAAQLIHNDCEHIAAVAKMQQHCLLTACGIITVSQGKRVAALRASNNPNDIKEYKHARKQLETTIGTIRKLKQLINQ